MVCIHSRSTRQSTALQAVSVATPVYPVHHSVMAAQSKALAVEVQADENDLAVRHPRSVGGYIPQGAAYHAPVKAARGRCGRLQRWRRSDRSRQVHHGAHAFPRAACAWLRSNGYHAPLPGHWQHVMGDSPGWRDHSTAYGIGDIQR